MDFQTLLTLIELTKKKTPLLFSTISKPVVISQKQISPIMMIQNRSQDNKQTKLTLFGLFFSTMPSRSASTSRDISATEPRQHEACLFLQSHQHEAVYSYSTDTVYISIIHQHRRSPCLKMKTSETYRQLLDAARRPPATRFSLHSTSQIAETDQKKNKHKLNYCDNYCAIIVVFFD